MLTPDTLTFEQIRSWDGKTMREQMQHPEMREAIQRVLQQRTLPEVVQAQEEIESRTEPEVVAVQPTVEEVLAAEQQRQAEEAARKLAETPKKFIADYQIKDEDGNPIGRPTHLEAATEDELRAKLIEAHTQAARAFHRLKKQKVSFKEQKQPAQQPVEPSDAELLQAMNDLRSEDPKKQLDGFRKVQQAERDRIKSEQDTKKAQEDEEKRQFKASQDFLKRHQHDFNNCQANINLIKEFFEENQELAWTLDNLEIAFHALEDRLAPVVSVVPVVEVNPPATAPASAAVPPAAAVAVTPAAQAAVQPPATAPARAAAPANPVPAAPRPGVNGGLVPGESSGSRTTGQPAKKELTAEEIRSWDGATMRAKMRDPRIRPQIDAFFASRTGKK